ncbi:hypothetical protein [Alkaliphilus sp. B6464]|uniref:hypothetical protein n=1 Tax=Alkaliphilus sp. B6464 TaxID=2731219 RepID=UPI001BAC43FE|nr:hypothetical protein [Alkaliphilus sp. B6464]QUH22221.1 hypothetical protein HYG84_20145 [Alkaliphilus sp. B6464]
MDINKNLKVAISKKQDGIIDSLLFISKIEKKKNEKFDYNEIKNIVQEYYALQCSYSLSFLYSEDELENNLFYNLSEVELNDGELITDRIKNRINSIKNINVDTKYKKEAIGILKEYLKEISINESTLEVEQIAIKYFLKDLLSSALFLAFLISPLIIYLLKNTIPSIDSSPKSVYLHLMLQIIGFSGLLFLGHVVLLLKGYVKRYATYMIIFSFSGLLYLGVLGQQYVNTTGYNFNEKVEVISVNNYKENSEIKTITYKIKNKEKIMIAHKGLGIKSNSKYKISGHKFTGVILEAEEIK